MQQPSLFAVKSSQPVSTEVESGPRFHIPCGQPLGANGRCSACGVHAAADKITIHTNLAESFRRIWRTVKNRRQRRAWYEQNQLGRTVGPAVLPLF